MIAFTILSYIVYKITNPYEVHANEKDTEVSGYLADTFTNNINLKLFSSVKHETSSFEAILSKWQTSQSKSWFASGFGW